MDETDPRPVIRLLSLSDVAELTSLSRATIYRLRNKGQFPRALQISSRRVAWDATAVENWRKTRSTA